MKHHILILAILTVFMSKAFSQTDLGFSCSVGISKEPNWHKDNSFTPAFGINGLYSYSLNSKHSFRVNLGFKKRGYKEHSYDYFFGGQYLDYTNFYLVSFGPDYVYKLINKRVLLYSILGQRASYLIHYKYSYDNDGAREELFNPRRIQFETHAGIGIQLKSGFYSEINFEISTISKKKRIPKSGVDPRDLYFGFTFGKILIK
ncbi:MAG: outer membrane beta-barrel protein [Bacteroidetes bacterium]|jgi:hypothetical protein|nr:outer membrane beta-barrel protein [Bacteroidota bacterium]